MSVFTHGFLRLFESPAKVRPNRKNTEIQARNGPDHVHNAHLLGSGLIGGNEQSTGKTNPKRNPGENFQQLEISPFTPAAPGIGFVAFQLLRGAFGITLIP